MAPSLAPAANERDPLEDPLPLIDDPASAANERVHPTIASTGNNPLTVLQHPSQPPNNIHPSQPPNNIHPTDNPYNPLTQLSTTLADNPSSLIEAANDHSNQPSYDDNVSEMTNPNDDVSEMTNPNIESNMPTVDTNIQSTTSADNPKSDDNSKNTIDSPVQEIEIDNNFCLADDDITVETRTTVATTTRALTPLRSDGKFYYFNFMWPYPNADSLHHLKVVVGEKNSSSIKYFGFAMEVGEGGMPHYQGVFYVKNPRTVSAVSKLFNTKKKRPKMRAGEKLEGEVGNCANITPVGAKPNKNKPGSFTQIKALNCNPWTAFQYIMKGDQPHEEWEKYKSNGLNYGKNLNMVYEKGTRPTKEMYEDILLDKRGQRTDVDQDSEFMSRLEELVDEHFVQLKQIDIKDTLEEEFPKQFQRFPNWCLRQIERKTKCHKEQPLEDRILPKLYQWQQDLMKHLEPIPDGRTIRIYWDPVGKCGKTKFKTHYRSLFPYWCVYLSPGAKKDLVSQYNDQSAGKDIRVFMMDCPRSKGNEGIGIPYDMIEQILDGELHVSKYMSVIVNHKPPHVVMFMNHEPDYTKLSLDRIQLFKFPEEDDPNPLLDKDGNRMCVRMSDEYIKEGKRLLEEEKASSPRRGTKRLLNQENFHRQSQRNQNREEVFDDLAEQYVKNKRKAEKKDRKSRHYN